MWSDVLTLWHPSSECVPETPEALQCWALVAGEVLRSHFPTYTRRTAGADETYLIPFHLFQTNNTHLCKSSIQMNLRIKLHQTAIFTASPLDLLVGTLPPGLPWGPDCTVDSGFSILCINKIAQNLLVNQHRMCIKYKTYDSRSYLRIFTLPISVYRFNRGLMHMGKAMISLSCGRLDGSRLSMLRISCRSSGLYRSEIGAKVPLMIFRTRAGKFCK